MGFSFIRQKAFAILTAAVLTICGIFAGCGTVLAKEGGVYPEHGSYGTGVGAKPGRVVWFHDRDSVDWDGNGYWWDTGNFNEEVVQKMVDESIASLAGKEGAEDKILGLEQQKPEQGLQAQEKKQIQKQQERGR